MNKLEHVEDFGQEKLVIIDTDCGVDDALAIILATHCERLGGKDGGKKLKILGITCVDGNCGVDQVLVNVSLTLKACDVKDLKVYKGCHQSFLRTGPMDEYLGKDGLGNAAESLGPVDVKCEDQHAVQALIGFAKKYPKKVTVLCLGPLTNLAMAHMMDPNFFNSLESVYILGGNTHALGNCAPTVEFNFGFDPEAVDIVLTNAKCPLVLVPWETLCDNASTWESYKKIVDVTTDKGLFARAITREMYEQGQVDIWGAGFNAGDAFCVIAFAYPEAVLETKEWPAKIELHGQMTRGQLVVDRRQEQPTLLQGTRLKMVTKFNLQIVEKLLFDMLRG